MARVHPSQQSPRGADILGFLRTFEGAAATFGRENGHWSLWLPELAADGHPLTPASQIFFPVILRNDAQAFAIRFFYDCATGKVRYYTSAIPDEIARLPEFENAISELFRHSLPVEAIRQRKLREGLARSQPALEANRSPRSAAAESLAEPIEAPRPAPSPEPKRPMPAATPAPASAAPPAARPSAALVPAPPVERPIIAVEAVPPPPAPAPAAAAPGERHVRLELGPGARHVLLVLIGAMALVALAAIGTYAYLQATKDPGLEHHRLQIEEMRAREGR